MTEAELAAIEELVGLATGSDTLPYSIPYLHQVAATTPVLVAEVRRLKAEIDRLTD